MFSDNALQDIVADKAIHKIVFAVVRLGIYNTLDLKCLDPSQTNKIIEALTVLFKKWFNLYF